MSAVKTMSHTRTKDVAGDFVFDQQNLYRSFTKTIAYVNRTGRSMMVIDRSGMRVWVRSEAWSSVQKQAFLILTNFTIPVDSIEEIKTFLLSEQYDTCKSQLMQVFREEFLRKYTEYQNRVTGGRVYCGISVTIESSISVDEFQDNNELYIANHDIVVTNEDNPATLHPFTDTSLLYDRYRELIDERNVAFGVEFVDNTKAVGDRFFYALKRTVRIKSVVDLTRESGVYVMFYDSNSRKPVGNVEYFTFEEAEKAIGLYASAEEAETGGNPEKLAERAVLKLREELAAAEASYRLEEKKAATLVEENKREKLKLEQELLTIKNMYEMRKMRLENEFADRTARRSDDSSIIKFFAATVTAALAVALAMLKLQKA